MEANAYAVAESDATVSGGGTGSGVAGCSVAMLSFFLLGFLVLFVGNIGTSLYREWNPPRPLFKYGDAVEVVAGFNEGCRGMATSARFRTNPTDPVGHWEYCVRLDSGSEFVAEADLRKLEGVAFAVDAYGRVRYGRIVDAEELFGRTEQLEDDVADLRRRPSDAPCRFPPADEKVGK